jgi:hypothetical protein
MMIIFYDSPVVQKIKQVKNRELIKSLLRAGLSACFLEEFEIK